MVELLALKNEIKFVMPAEAGIQDSFSPKIHK
jgi:hypothetical protein